MKEHYYTEKPTSELRISTIKARLRGREFTFKTGSGVFSIKHIDNGTQLLIDNAIVTDGQRILDLGCGYGPVGIALKKIFPKCEVVLTDINERAIKLARQNAKLNGVQVDLVQGDKYSSVTGKFDVILVNPPQNAGKDVCFEMIVLAKDYLNDGGSLQLVARHQKGGKSLSSKMEEVFGNVDIVKRGGGFRVYISQN
ncbi:MAG: class I SAM-dependent methyltransferase [Nanoarchaeota archaeon]|nr:class I SAM-dependent methyltransferase [Nanoarchaeota archaeon]MBU1704049.1 class I SAM-dependent methyltransferase [Nanoarchaeota archaeon]